MNVIRNYLEEEPVVTSIIIRDPKTGDWAIFLDVRGKLLACEVVFDTQEEAEEALDRIMAAANDLMDAQGWDFCLRAESER